MANGAVENDFVFTDDLYVVDYLTTLLSSSPQFASEFSPVYFKTRPDPSSKPTLVGKSVIDNTGRFKAEIAIREAENLRSENESLKFKTELAKIDSEVLRGENNKLKNEISRINSELADTKKELTSEIVEVRKQFESVSTENRELKDQIDPLRTQVQLLSEMLAEKVPEKEAVQMSETQALSDREPVPALKPQVNHEERRVVANAVNASAFSERATESADGQQLMVVQGGMTDHKKDARKNVFSQSHQLQNSSVSSQQSVSKIIKLRGVRTEAPVTAKMPEKNPQKPLNNIVVMDEQVAEKPVDDKKPAYIQSRPAADPQMECLSEVPAAGEPVEKDVRKPLDIDEIKLESAPVSKTVKRINARNYELLQQEADEEPVKPGQNLAFTT